MQNFNFSHSEHVILKSLMLVFMMTGIFSSLQAQGDCNGNCNDGVTPCYNFNLPTPDASIPATLMGGGNCCLPTQIPGNQNCVQLFISYPAGTAGLEITSTDNPSPCSNDLYDASGGCGNLGAPIEFCDPYCPDPLTINPLGGTFELLVCKPGNFVDVNVVVTGVPVVVVTTPDVNDNGADCAPEFSVFGLQPGQVVTWSPMTYLTCLDLDCQYATFEYTGPAVIDCDGIQLPYTITIPATACDEAQVVNRIVTVYPTTQGDFDVICSDDQLNMTFVPDVPCPDLQYQWYDENDLPIMGATGPTLTIPEDMNVYTLEVYRPAVDACENFQVSAVATCCQVPEFISCPPNLVITTPDTDPLCNIVEFETPAATDGGCGPVTVTQISGPLSGTPFMVGVPYTIVFEAENANGQTAQCSFTITLVLDNELTLYCPFDVNICSDPGTCNWLSEGLDVITSPNCGNLVLSYQVSGATTVPQTVGTANGILFNQGISFVTYTLEDTNDPSLTTICSFSVTVNDCEAPILTCPADQTMVECGTEDVLAWANSVIATDVASCSFVTVDFFLQTSTELCGEAQLDTYIFIATDAAGNTSTCVASYGTVDTTPPSIDTPASDMTVNCDGANNAAEILAWLNNNGGAEASDDCSPVFWTNDYGSITNPCDGQGSITVTFTATDECGNASETTATFTINDNTAPVWILAPSNLTVECDGTIDPLNQIQAWLDIAGGGEADDECSLVTYSNDFTGLSDECGETGSATVTFTATDGCGNPATIEATVTVVDNTAPFIELPAQDLVVECDGNGNITALNDWLNANGNAVATDACSTTFTWSNSLVGTTTTCGGTEVQTYAFTATDECGNTSVQTTADFIIIDTTSPTIDVAPSEQIVDCDGNGNTVELFAWLNAHGGAMASDICSEPLSWGFVLVNVQDSCGTTGRNTYRFIVSDACGNTSTAEADFVIRDITAPVITAPAVDLDVECDGSNNAAAISAWLNSNGGASATDECGTITWSNDYGNINASCGTTGSVTVIFTATDDCGNSTTTSAVFTINDDVAPFWEILPADLSIECDGTNDPMGQIQAWLATSGGGEAEDSCSLVNYFHDYTGFTGGCSATTGSALVTFVALDACGNATTAQATVTVSDNTAPTITSPAIDIIVECDGFGNPAELSVWLANNGGATASDACSNFTWNTPVLVETIVGCGETQTLVYAFSVTDECGNTSVNTIANFIIIDTTPPDIILNPEDLTVECDGNGNLTELNDWLTANGEALADDVCNGEQALVWEYDLISTSDDCGITESNTYRFTVYDDCGNSSTAEAVFVVEDTTPPSIDVPASDFTAECNGASNAAEILNWLNNNGFAEASDDCGVLTWTNDYGTIVADCGASGQVTVTFTVTDECGNSSTTDATFFIDDTTAPFWEILPTDLEIECDGTTDPMGQIQAWLDNVGGAEAEDSCSLIVYMNDYTGFTGGCSEFTGSAVVTFTASDACGNMTTAQATVTVVDNIPPDIIVPATDTIVECDGLGNPDDLASWLANNGNAEATDICSNITWNTPVLVETIEGCGGTVTYVYSFDADDECGNTSAATIASFIIIDTTPPEITTVPMDETVECDGNGNITELTDWLNSNGSGVATDICNDDENLVWEYDLISTSDDCGITESNTYRFTVYDDCGNSSTAEAVFTIEDTTPPSIDVPASDFTAECDGANNADQIQNWLNNNGFAEASDACGVMTWTNDFGTIITDCGTTGEVTVTFTVTDECGNSSSTTATFFINDTTDPYFEIPASDLEIECDGTTDPMGQIQAWLDNIGGAEAEDSCSYVIYSNDYTGFTGGCSEFTGSALVTFTATDACGNNSITQATVTVVDNTPPEILSPAIDTIVECDGLGNPDDLASWLANNGNATAFDVCSNITWNTPVLIETLDNCGGTLVYVYSFTADDECGNTSAATIANFIIIDTTPPEITTAPMDMTVECDGNGNITELTDWLNSNGSGVATDICNDDNALVWEYDLVSATDSCGITESRTYRFTVYDECGNSSTAEAVFVVEDTTPPSIDVPASDFTAECNGASNAAEILNWLNNNGFAEASDDCGVLTWTNNYGTIVADCGASGQVTVTFTVTDECGNSSTTDATFFIDDTTAPFWEILPTDLEIECDGTTDPMGQIQAWLDNVGGAEAEDSCSLIVYMNDYTGFTGGCSEFTGSALVTFTASDACGNMTTAQATVTVVDNIPPDIIVPATDTIVECDGLGNPDDLASWLANNGNAEATDICSNITWNTPVLVETIEGCGGTVTYVYSFDADDECGNTSAATIASFIIIDTTPPEITTVPMDETVECDGNGNITELTDWLNSNGSGVATDICNDDENLVWEYDLVSATDSCGITESKTYRFTVYDECGNSSTSEAVFVIEDTTPPSIDVPASDYLTECDGSGNTDELLDWLNNNGFAEASDDCGVITWSNNYGTITTDCGSAGSVTVTFTATDECGNSSTTTATFTIVDTTAPFWEILPADLEVECDGTNDPMGQIQAWLDIAGGAEAEDTCSFVSYTNDYTGFTGGCSEFTGSALVTFTAHDACGNNIDAQATVTVVDNLPPDIIVPATDTIVECDGMGNPGDLASWLANNGNAEATDVCSNITWNTPVLVETIEGCGGTLTYVYSFDADDECGNTSAATIANFIIIDTTPPSIDTAPMDETVECDGNGNLTELNDWLLSNGSGVASDICNDDNNLVWTYDLVNTEDECGITETKTYRFTVTDECGNTATAEADFIIEDTTPPSIDVDASDFTAECNGSNNGAEILNWLNNNGFAQASDDCGVITWTNDYGSVEADCGASGSVVVTFTATDECGNSSTTSATFFINDTTAPFWETPAADLTIECDGTSDPSGQIQAWLVTNGGGEAEDSCSLVVYTNDYQGVSNGCSATTGSALVTFTATDACGNSSTVQATVTIEDTTAPEITNPAQDETVECDGDGNQTELNDWLNNNGGAAASDICSNFTWNTPVLIESIPGCGNTVTLVYSFSATDECGNTSANTTASFQIIDTTSPSIDAPATEYVAECDGDGNITELEDWLNNNGNAAASDICSDGEGLSWSYDLVSSNADCGVTGVSLYRFTVSDECGNTSTTEANFIIEDTTPPSIDTDAQNVTTECGESNDNELLDWLNNNGNASASDDCGNITWSNDFGSLSDGCGETGSVTVTFVATDDCGNLSSTTATFEIIDLTPPVWEIPAANLTLNCENNSDPLGQITNWLNTAGGGEAEDDCSLVTYTNDYTGLSQGCSPNTGSALVTFTATDACGNTSTSQATVSVVDNELPYFDLMAQDETVECDGDGNLEELQAWLDNHGGAIAFDDCSEPLTWNATLFDTDEQCGNTVTYTYSFTATDACGNVSPQSLADFIIEDTTPPEFIEFPTGENVECDDEGIDETLQDWLDNNGGATAEDICSEEITWSYELINQIGCGGGGFMTYRFYATDACGNSSSADATFGIGTDDEGGPIVLEGEDLFVECDQENANNDDDLLGWLNTNAGASANISCLDLNWSNNFDPANWVYDCGSTRHVDVVFTASDGCGNSISFEATFGTVDNTAPEFENCPRPPIVVDAPAGWCASFANFSPVAAEDNCGDVTITQIDDTGLSSGDLFPVGTTILIWEATDACGNSDTCSFKVIVNDYHTPPVISCPDDQELDNSPFLCGAILEGLDPDFVSDNCIDNVAVTFEIVDANGDVVACGVETVDGAIAPVGMNTATYTAQDQPILLITEVVQGGVTSSNSVWINEFHYDNTGTDVGEFIEVAGSAGTDLNGYTLLLYNGSNGLVYNTINLAGVIADQSNGFGAVDFALPSNGLQNGSPDGIALIDPSSNVLYFLSYEGTFVANDGAASGMNSVDIGISEDSNTPVGNSLQLTGTGSAYSDFTWAADLASNGQINQGQMMVPAGSMSEDAIEITNFGPASMDISCLVIAREGNGVESFVVPMGVVLGVGDTYVYNFNTGLSNATPAGYTISFENAVFDEVATNAYQFANSPWSGDIIGGSARRLTVCDHDNSGDWMVLTECDGHTLGMLNDGLTIFTDNGTTTSLQSEPASSSSCSFTILVEDVEAPTCAMYIENMYNGPSGSIEGAGCITSEINVLDIATIGLVNILNLDISTDNAADLNVTLTSPEGTTITLFAGLCDGSSDVLINLSDTTSQLVQNAPCGPLGNGGMYKPQEGLGAFYAENSGGTWYLSISVSGGSSTTLNGWTLEILGLDTYDQNDVVLLTDPGICGAEFTWNHPVLQDNCGDGTLVVEYETDDPFIKGGVVNSGEPATETFPTGTTTVTYTLTDENGNVNTCSFTVTVIDEEIPTLVNGCLPDITISLDAGECCTYINFVEPAVNDNCEVTDIGFFPPTGSEFCVGTTPVEVTIVDASGNSINCSFNVTIFEYNVTEPFNFVCNDEINISLDASCQATITADMILEGNNYACYDDYCITLTDANGNVLPDNTLGLESVGQTYTVSVSDCIEGGNSCWGIINVFDYTNPQIECPEDITVACNDPYDIIATGEVTILSCETNAVVSYTDIFTDFGVCANPRAEILRTWVVSDVSGNSSSCTQTILVQPFELDVVEFPEDVFYEDALSCSEVAENPDLTEPAYTGEPTIDGLSLFGDHFCEVNIGYWDEMLYDANCPGAYEIHRHWIVSNECLPLEEGVNPKKHIQRIKVEDFTPPNLEALEDITLSTDSWGCGLTYPLPLPQISDNCTPDDEIKISYGVLGGVIAGNTLHVQSPANGDVVEVTVIAEDNCKNVSTTEFTISIFDMVPPTIVADLHTTVTLTTGGEGKLYAIDLDDGSHDGCGPLGFYLNRMDSACPGHEEEDNVNTWYEYVHFCCDDIQFDSDGELIPVMVQLRVCDDADLNGIPGEGDDNCSIAMVEVDVQDKLAPVIECPEDMTINCIDYAALGDLSALSDEELNTAFGEATVISTCGGEPDQVLSGTEICGNGVVNRIFTVSTAGGSSTCIQKIFVEPDENGDNLLECSDITFPSAPESSYNWCLSASNGGPISDFGAIIVNSQDCGGFTPQAPEINIDDLCTEVGVNMTIDTFAFAGGGCYKYIVHWEVIDQCLFDENFVDPETGETNPFHTENGYFHIYVEYDVFDNEGPVVNCEEEYIINCDESVVSVISGSATDNCTAPEYFGWNWKIDFGNDFVIDKEGQGSTAVGPFPVGTHRIIWIVSDGCGNTTTQNCIITISQEDNKAPTPYCYNGLSTAVMQPATCSIEIDATDFDAGSFDDCSENLVFTMIPEVDAANEANPYAASTPSWLFDCSYITNGVYEVIPIRIYVTDASGNYDFCVADLRIDDNFDCCEDMSNASGKIAGMIETEFEEPVSEVTVEANTNNIEYPKYFETQADGVYAFESNPLFYDYTISSEKDFDYLNGVTTLDIVIIQKHILSIAPLDSPYKLIAADVNSDCVITASDLLQLRKLILGKYTDDNLPNNESWRFVDADFVFNNPNQPCPFDEVIEVDSLTYDELNENFIGVKIGDVNQSVIPNLNVNSETRNSAPLYFEVQDRIVKAGEIITVPVYAKNFEKIFGYQMTWSVNKDLAKFNKFKSGKNTISDENYGLTRLDEGLISMSWHNIMSSTVENGDVLFSFELEVAKDGLLSQILSMNDRMIVKEIYQGDELKVHNLELMFTTEHTNETGNQFELYQNEPNPFDKQTIIGFTLPDKAHVTLRFYDATGKTLKLIEDDYSAGYHEAIVKQTELNASGVIYYQLQTDNNVATRKMIILN